MEDAPEKRRNFSSSSSSSSSSSGEISVTVEREIVGGTRGDGNELELESRDDVAGSAPTSGGGSVNNGSISSSSAQQTKTMPSHLQDNAIVLMGVSGAGKSTIGELLAKRLNSKFLDADDFHPQANKDKMRDGIPLTDEDRIPWLATLRDKLRESLESERPIILGCSALRKGYREILRSADPDYELGSYKSKTRFVLLNAKADVLAERIRKRSAEGKHFMPVKLLQSQLDLLQIEDCEGIFKVDATLTPQQIVNTIVNSLIY